MKVNINGIPCINGIQFTGAIMVVIVW